MALGLPFGSNKSWDDLVRCQVDKFTAIGQVIDGQVIAPSRPQPLALLDVSCGESKGVVAIPHKIDFQNAWSIFHLGLPEGMVVLVSYYKYEGFFKRMLGAGLPHLVFQVYAEADSRRQYPIEEIWPYESFR